MNKEANRIWLNPDKGSSGALIWYVEGRGTCDVYAQLEFADCNRKVSLEFGAHGDSKKTTRRRLKARMEKLRRVQRELVRFEEALEAAYDALE